MGGGPKALRRWECTTVKMPDDDARPRDDASSRWLLADVGGTHLRFAWTDTGAEAETPLHDLQVVRADDEASFTQAVRGYLSDAGHVAERAIVCVAARVVRGEARMTNRAWHLSARALERTLGLTQVRLVNDLAAAAAMLPLLDDASAPLLWPTAGPTAAPIAQGSAAEPSRCVVLGPGTGLGVAAASIAGGVAQSQTSEGGHAGYAPESERDWALALALRQSAERVSWEHVVSGPGLVRVYRAFGTAAATDAPAIDTAERIVAGAAAGDARCRQALAIFGEALAAVAGDCVLMHGAWDGVYLIGSLVQAAQEALAADACRARFAAKGPFAAAMAQVPVRLVRHPQPVLLGAAQLVRHSSVAPLPWPT